MLQHTHQQHGGMKQAKQDPMHGKAGLLFFIRFHITHAIPGAIYTCEIDNQYKPGG